MVYPHVRGIDPCLVDACTTETKGVITGALKLLQQDILGYGRDRVPNQAFGVSQDPGWLPIYCSINIAPEKVDSFLVYAGQL